MKPTFLLCLLAAACSPAVNTSLKNDLQNTKPTWLSAKPDQSFYYIGIGHSTKTGTNNFVQEAKKSALEDLVSEIKVNVSGTSVLSQIDANKEFQEKYEQIIKTTAADEIEEFEQVDSWQDDRNYWVYYRLSKQRYKEIKDEQFLISLEDLLKYSKDFPKFSQKIIFFRKSSKVLLKKLKRFQKILLNF